MRAKGVVRLAMVVGVVGMLGAMFLAPPAAASGGGGCGRAITEAAGTAVRIHNFCFGPTVIHVARGSAVTWTNRDGVDHTVLGANGRWGSYQALSQGQSFTYRFDRAGVYPYVCTIHAGMTGAVVVGHPKVSGVGITKLSAGAVVPVAAVQTPSPQAPAEPARPVAAVDRAGSASHGWEVTAWAAIAALAAALLGLVAVARRRRTGPAVPAA